MKDQTSFRFLHFSEDGHISRADIDSLVRYFGWEIVDWDRISEFGPLAWQIELRKLPTDQKTSDQKAREAIEQVLQEEHEKYYRANEFIKSGEKFIIKLITLGVLEG